MSSDLAAVELQAQSKQIAKILKEPNKLSNTYTFWQTIYAQLLLSGNAYVRIYGDTETGRVSELEYLSPSQVTVKKDELNESLWYDINYFDSSRPNERDVPADFILHFRICSTNGILGNSPLVALSNELELQDSNTKFTLNAFKNIFNLKGILEIQRTDLSEKAKTEMKRQFMEALKTDGVGIVDQVSKYHSIEINNDLAKMLRATDWTSEQIAKVFGIPKDYLGSESEHSNIEMVSNLYTTALSRYIRPVTSETTMKFGTEIKPSIGHVLDMDGQLLEKRVANLVKNGVLTSGVAQEILLQSSADILNQTAIDEAISKGYEVTVPTKGVNNKFE